MQSNSTLQNTPVYKFATNPVSVKPKRSHLVKEDRVKLIARSRIIEFANKLVGNHKIAEDWYNNQPIKAFDHKIAKQLVSEGNAKAVLMHLEILGDGGYS